MTVREEVLTQIGALVTAAFGLVAALAWNGAIQALFTQIFGTTDTLMGQLIYAIIVTIVAVVATLLIARSIAAAKNERAPTGVGPDWGKKK
jgi:hypothetical protein